MSNCNIKIPAALYERLKALAREKGYSSAEEMILHVLEKTAAGADCSASRLALRSHPDEAGGDADSSAVISSIKRQLKGLGYFNG